MAGVVLDLEPVVQVERIGRGRVILARCDNEAMVRNGQKMGITMFQGFYVDDLFKQG